MIRGTRNERRRMSQGAGFRRPVANLAPSVLLNDPPRIQRTAHRFGTFSEGRRSHNGQIAVTAGADPRPVGEFTVASNNFATGRAAILLGDYVLVAGIDFLVGGGVAATATNAAAAINNIDGWDAAAVGAVVTLYAAFPGKVRFEVRHYGTVTNFNTLTGLGAAVLTETDLLNDGGQTTGPPTLT